MPGPTQHPADRARRYPQPPRDLGLRVVPTRIVDLPAQLFRNHGFFRGSEAGGRGYETAAPRGVGNRSGKRTFCRKSPGKKDITAGIVPKKRHYARNRCGKTTLGQITPGRTIRRPGVDAAFVPPITTLVKSPFRPDCLAARKLRRGPGAARDLGRNPRAGAAGETMEIRGSETHGGLLQRGAGHKYCQSAHWKITTYGDAGHRSCQG
jgi:hypothetical protein